MPTTVRIRKITDPEIQIILTRAPGEDNHAPPADLAIKGHDTRVARRNPVSSNEWMLVVSGAVGTIGAATVQAITSWLNGKNGRHCKIKDGDREYEAASPKDLEKVVKLARDQLDIRILPPTEKMK